MKLCQDKLDIIWWLNHSDIPAVLEILKSNPESSLSKTETDKTRSIPRQDWDWPISNNTTLLAIYDWQTFKSCYITILTHNELLNFKLSSVFLFVFMAWMGFHINLNSTSAFSFRQTNMSPDKLSMRLVFKHEVPADWRKLTMCQSCLLYPVSITIKQNAPLERRTEGGPPWKNPASIVTISHSKLLGSWKLSPAGLRKCECACCECACVGAMCNMTIPFLSLMSHQCASMFSRLEYINTSVYQVLHLQWV